MAHGRGRGRHKGGHEEESGERWLLTYADMITLLMALFMVLFSISSVNISKYQTLQESLRAAFSGNILPGGKAISQQGSTANASHVPATMELQALEPVATMGASSVQNSTAHGAPGAVAAATHAAAQQQAVFLHIKQELERYAAAHGFSKSVQTSIERRGLVIRVLTDDLLFETGQATLENRSHALLGEIAQLLNIDVTHPIDVEGHTDSVPIHGGTFPSNWELSTARASTVVRYLVERSVNPRRLAASGYADQRPIASDATAAGRTRNRRVEIVLQRLPTGEGEP